MSKKRNLSFAALLVAAGFGGFGLLSNKELPRTVEDRGFSDFSGGGGFEDEQGRPAALDTFRLLVRDSVYTPTLAAATTDDDGVPWVRPDVVYDLILEDQDGSHLRYTSIKSTAADTVTTDLLTGDYGGLTGRAAEYDAGPAGWFTFIWYDISDLPANCKIVDAYVHISPRDNAFFYLGSGYFAARADTNTADFAMLNTGSVNADPGWMNISWTNVYKDSVTDSVVAWSPALAVRDDWNDFGPTGERYAPGDTVTSDEAVRLDISDPLQQVIDNGNKGRGLLVVISTTDTSAGSHGIRFGNSATRTVGGNPALTVTAVTRRGTRPWSGVRMPVSVVLDDNKPADPDIYALWDSLGWTFTSAAYRDSWDAAADSLWSANSGAMDIVMHSKTHARFTTLTDAQINVEVARDWVPTYITDPAIADTSALVDFAWVGGDVPKYTLNAIPILINNGYRSARAATVHADDSPIGELTYASWENFVNLFAVSSESMTQSLLSETVHSKATLAERFKDMVDQSYTNRGKAAILLYAHGYTALGDSLLTGPQRLRWFADVVNSTSGVEYKTHDWIMDQLCSRDLVPPSLVTEANGATAVTATAAAKYDSLITANGSASYWANQVWVGPKDWTFTESYIDSLTVADSSYLGVAFPTTGTYWLLDEIGVGAARIEASWVVGEPTNDSFSQGVVTRSDELIAKGITPYINLVCDHTEAFAVPAYDSDCANQVPVYAEWEEFVTTFVDSLEAHGVNNYLLLNEWTARSNSNGGWPADASWGQLMAFVDSTTAYIEAADADAAIYICGPAATQALFLMLYDEYITYPVYFESESAWVTRDDLIADGFGATLDSVKIVYDFLNAHTSLDGLSLHQYGTETHVADRVAYFDANWGTKDYISTESGGPSLSYVASQSDADKFNFAWYLNLHHLVQGVHPTFWFKNIDTGSQSAGNDEVPMLTLDGAAIDEYRGQWYAYRLLALCLENVPIANVTLQEEGVYKLVNSSDEITYMMIPGRGDGIFTVPADMEPVQIIYASNIESGKYRLGEVPAPGGTVNFISTPVILSEATLIP